MLIIDEAAAIPLPFVKSLMGNYMVFMCSTINGYEGTGRSLSLKLLSSLRQANTQINKNNIRLLKEFKLEEPIRYAGNDPVEKWLFDLLLLDATVAAPLQEGLPHPNDCELYLVNRDTLFSF